MKQHFDTALGYFGAAMAVIFPYLNFLTEACKFLGAFGGVILVILSIRHKIIETRKLKKDGRDRKR